MSEAVVTTVISPYLTNFNHVEINFSESNNMLKVELFDRIQKLKG